MKYTILLLALIIAGCTTRTAQTPDGKVIYKSTRFGNKEAIKRVEYRGADGVVFILEGYSSDQVEGMGIVAEAAARGAVQGMTGGAGTAGAATKAPVQKMEISEFGAFVPPASGGYVLTPNFPLPGQPVLLFDGKTITTNIYRPLDGLRK